MASILYDIYVPIRNDDGTVMWYKLVDKGTGTNDYTQLSNLPKINNVEIIGNKTLAELGIVIPTKLSDLVNDEGYIDISALVDYTKKSELPTKVSELTNDIGFQTAIQVVGIVANATYTKAQIDDKIPTNVSQLENDKDYMSYDEMVLIENDPTLGTYICRLGQEGTPLTYDEIKDAVDNPESFVFIRYGGCLYIPNVEPENNAIRFVARYPAVNAASYSRTLSIGISTTNQIILRETQDERIDNKVSDMSNVSNVRYYPTAIAVKNFVEGKGYLVQSVKINDFTSSSITLIAEANHHYNYGELTTFNLDFSTTGGNEIEIIFKSGATATNLIVSSTNALFSEFTPSANAVVEINAKWYEPISKWVVLFNEVAL